VLLAGVLAFSCTGCGAISAGISTPQVSTPTKETRFISLPGIDLPDQELPPEPEPLQNPLTTPDLPESQPELIFLDENGEEIIDPSAVAPESVVIIEVAPTPTPAIVISEPATPLAAAPQSPQQSNPVADVISSIISSNQSTAEEAPIVDYSYDEEAANTEEYALPDEQGFYSTSTNPLSTFSADVDTASYTNLRRMINQGGVLEQIPSGAVRIEEMLNYFSYDFIMPDEGKPFALNVQVADCPWNPESRLMILGLQAQTLTDPSQAYSNLVFLIDVSGSMNEPDKLNLLKKSFSF